MPLTMYDYPRWSSLLRPRTLSIFLQNMTTRGPRTFSGGQQVGSPDVGRWVMRAGFQVFGGPRLNEWRGIVTDMQGGLNTYLFPTWDEMQAPTLNPGDPVSITGIPHSDGSLFDDGSGYSQSTIVVSLNADVAVGDTAATLDIITAGPLARGMFFSIDGRLYQITKPPTFTAAVGDAPPTATVKFLPPARKAALAGDDVEFAQPMVLMRISDPKSGMADLSGIYYGEPTSALEESYDGL